MSQFPRPHPFPRVTAMQAALSALRFGPGGMIAFGAANALVEKMRESRDPKWAARRAGLTAALEARARERHAEEDHALSELESERDARIADLEDDVARLTLVTMTMMEMIVRKGIATREELSALVAEIDGLDGEPDGKLDPSALRPAPEDGSAES